MAESLEEQHGQKQSSHHHHQHQHQHHHQQQQQNQHQCHHQNHHHKHQHHQHHHHHQEQQQQQKQHQGEERGCRSSRDGGEQRRVIMVAMDGSSHSFYAFDWYMFHMHIPENEVIVAHSCPQANNFLAHAHNLMPCGCSHLKIKHNTSMPIAVTSDDPAMMGRLADEEQVNQIVARIKGRLTTSGVRGKLIRLSGDPGSAIVQAAKEHKVMCIVTGSRGLGTVKRTLIGSVSDYILHHAHCPVLICRHKEPKE